MLKKLCISPLGREREREREREIVRYWDWIRNCQFELGRKRNGKKMLERKKIVIL